MFNTKSTVGNNFWKLSTLVVVSIAISVSTSAFAGSKDSNSDKTYYDIQNTRQFFHSPINQNNVNKLKKRWHHTTTAPKSMMTTLLGKFPAAYFGAVNATPAVEGKYIYVNTTNGHITKLNRFTGKVIWKKNYIDDLSVPGYMMNSSRNTPYIVKDLLIVGSNFGLLSQLCKALGMKKPMVQLCIAGDGALVFAINKHTGKVVWRKKVDTHPATKVTGSISGSGNMIYVPVSHWEEDWARAYPDITQNPIKMGTRYKCCSARGSLVAIDISDLDNVGRPRIKWKTFTTSGDGTKVRVIGDEIDDIDNAKIIGLSDDLKDVLKEQGFWGTSTYGHNPTIDHKRGLIYIAVSQNMRAPSVAALCEKARRKTLDADAEVANLPAGLTCANLNQKLHNYGNSMVAVDAKTGEVKWQVLARKYDSWDHSCGAPDFYGASMALPFIFPMPLLNAKNCTQDPIGPDLGFGQQPMLVEGVNMSEALGGGTRDLVIAGNKDGRVFAVDADGPIDEDNTAKLVWETNADPGGILGGLQFGIATDGKRIYFGTSNTRNNGRVIKLNDQGEISNFVGSQVFLAKNGFTQLGIRSGPYVKKDGAKPIDHPAPGVLQLPFPGPNIALKTQGYPTSYPNPMKLKVPAGFMTGPVSGPSELWTLINPPNDVVVDGKMVIKQRGQLKTIAGMVHALDPSTGKIIWQRPATDSLKKGELEFMGVISQLAVGNGLVIVPYMDYRGTVVALDAKTGKKLFQFNHKDSKGKPVGVSDGGVNIHGSWMYFAPGSESMSIFPRSFGYQEHNKLYGFKLPKKYMKK